MIIGIIPAKGHSSRLPHKNMSLINGRPMIEYTINYAKQSKYLSKLYVSTEDETIAAYCRNIGVDVIKRDISLCGETPIIDVYRDAFRQLSHTKIDVIVGYSRTIRTEPLTLMTLSRSSKMKALTNSLAKNLTEPRMVRIIFCQRRF